MNPQRKLKGRSKKAYISYRILTNIDVIGGILTDSLL
jgi:hypothetical protein